MEISKGDPGVHADVVGGVRTRATGPDEGRRQQLRELYRRAADARRRARNAPAGSLERIQLQSEAKGYSAQIDRLKRELGLYKDEDYDRRRRQIEEELRRQRKRALRRKSWVVSRERRVKTLQRRVDWIQKEMNELPLFFLDGKQRSEKARLEAELREAREDLTAATIQEYMARREYRLQKALAKTQREELRRERRQLKLEQRQLKRENADPGIGP